MRRHVFSQRRFIYHNILWQLLLLLLLLLLVHVWMYVARLWRWSMGNGTSYGVGGRD